MWMTTGEGEAKKRAFAGVISAPLINWLKRMAPNVSGIALSRISPAGTHHGVRVFLASTFQYQHIHHHHFLQDLNLNLWAARYYRAVCQTSGRNRLAGFGWLSSANHLLCSSNVHFIHRTYSAATVDDHGTSVCRKRIAVVKWGW